MQHHTMDNEKKQKQKHVPKISGAASHWSWRRFYINNHVETANTASTAAPITKATERARAHLQWFILTPTHYFTIIINADSDISKYIGLLCYNRRTKQTKSNHWISFCFVLSIFLFLLRRNSSREFMLLLTLIFFIWIGIADLNLFGKMKIYNKRNEVIGNNSHVTKLKLN